MPLVGNYKMVDISMITMVRVNNFTIKSFCHQECVSFCGRRNNMVQDTSYCQYVGKNGLLAWAYSSKTSGRLFSNRLRYGLHSQYLWSLASSQCMRSPKTKIKDSEV